MRSLWIALLLVPLAGCATDAPSDCPEWHCREGYEEDAAWRQTVVPARTALEMDFPRKEGEVLAWDWFQPERKRFQFELHYHVGTDDRYEFQRDLAEDEDQYVPDRPGVYSLLWSNTSSEPLDVWVKVEGDQDAKFIPLG